MSILVVGSLALDTITTPFGKASEVLGGSVSYFSLAASFFEKVLCVGCVGDDFRSDYKEVFLSKGIDISGIAELPGKTFRWIGKYADDFDSAITIDTQLNVYQNFNPKIPFQFENTQYVFLANIHPKLQKIVLNQIKSPKLVCIDTMNCWIKNNTCELVELLPLVDILFVNANEARMITNESDLEKASKRILKMGPEILVIKRGSEGATLYFENNIFSIPACQNIKAIDPTGAGDTFAGGFIGYLARENSINFNSLKEALVVGNVMASYAIEDFSVNRLKNLNEQDIKTRIENFKNTIYNNF
jgi:sugar/nucleoside kinase (ribokinase family)